jgi:membrane protein
MIRADPVRLSHARQGVHEQPQTLPCPGQPPVRGRTAKRLVEIPWQGWKDILRRVAQEIRTDNLDLVAAGVTFYAMLALAPAMVAVVSLYGLFASPFDVGELLDPVFVLVPAGGARSLIQDLLSTAVDAAPKSLSLRAVMAVLLSVWSANRGMKAMIVAVGVTYEDLERHPFVRENLLSLGFVVGGVVFLSVAATLLIALPQLVRGSLIGEGVATVASLIRWPLLFTMLLAGLAGLYRWGPRRRPSSWRWVTPGALAATLMWMGFSALLSLYFSVERTTSIGHEGLDAVIALMLWVYVSVWAILLGAELNAELEHQTA